jgi:ABC-type transport system involved in cytochrome c biogenesis ATPase subunit
MTMVCAANLGKRHGREFILQDATFDVERGECVAFGGDDKGVSALLQILSVRAAPSEGTLTVAGLHARIARASVRRLVAYAAADALPAHGLCVSEYLAFITRARGSRPPTTATAAVRDALESAGVTPGSRVLDLTKSQQASVVLGAAILSCPSLLVVSSDLAIPQMSRTAFQTSIEELLSNGSAVAIAYGAGIPVVQAHRHLVVTGGKLSIPSSHPAPIPLGSRV